MSIIQNIVGFTSKSSLAKVGRSDTYNMYVETKDQNEHGFSTILKPMPGYRKVLDIPGKPQGIYRCSRSFNEKPAVYGVWGKKLYLITNDTKYFIGDVAGSGRVSFCETSGYGKNHPHIVLCDGVNVYAVDTILKPNQQQEYWKKINPIALPYAYPDSKVERITPAWVSFLYGYLVVGAAGTDIFYTSYQYPFEDRDESGKINYDIFDLKNTDYDKDGKTHTGFGWGHYTMSEWQPDNTIVGCSNGSRLFTFGERSFQVFAYQNSKEQPFASPDTASQIIGIRTKDSFAQYGDRVYWLGSADMGGNIVYSMGGDANPSRISTDDIEEMIAGYDKSVVRCFTMRWMSHPMYVMTFVNDDVTLAYDIKEGGWIRLGSFVSKGKNLKFRYEYSTISTDDKLWLQGNDVLVEATTDKWTEHDDTPIVRKRVGGVISSEHKPFKVNKVSIITNNGDYPNMVGKSVKVMMRYTKDGSIWQDVSSRSLGKTGQYGYDTVFRNLGRATHLSIELSCNEDAPFALYGIDLEAIRTN